MKKKVLIIGWIPQNKEEESIYTILEKLIKPLFNIVNTPKATKVFSWTNEERYRKAFQTVNESDIIIAEASKASVWLGMEIREADQKEKTIIVIAKSWSYISWLIYGCPAVKKIIFYKNISELETLVWDFLKNNLIIWQ